MFIYWGLVEKFVKIQNHLHLSIAMCTLRFDIRFAVWGKIKAPPKRGHGFQVLKHPDRLPLLPTITDMGGFMTNKSIGRYAFASLAARGGFVFAFQSMESAQSAQPP